MPTCRTFRSPAPDRSKHQTEVANSRPSSRPSLLADDQGAQNLPATPAERQGWTHQIPTLLEPPTEFQMAQLRRHPCSKPLAEGGQPSSCRQHHRAQKLSIHPCRSTKVEQKQLRPHETDSGPSCPCRTVRAMLTLRRLTAPHSPKLKYPDPFLPKPSVS
ncbi:hypothetical protein L3X38_024681 [Prunus dulcis]|uniref:Uncharacterized protein n=1 Tax=Prunus dulcis TaxID=3755 RepID=A0AAD4W0C6_PRUDU|nr:hypothetical protein L3X38_024681 [Prunus dulcis]